MSESQDGVNVDELGQAAHSGQLTVVVDALTKNKQLAHGTDTVGVSLAFLSHFRNNAVVRDPSVGTPIRVLSVATPVAVYRL